MSGTFTDSTPHQEACQALETELRRTDGVTTILVVGERCSGKTTVCETVLKRMNRHIVRWTPYQEFIAGHVSHAYSGLDTIVFVDDADVLVRLTKGSSVGLMDAMESCKLRPHIRIVMTALDTKGRVWRSVASKAGLIQFLPAVHTAHMDASGSAKGRGRGRGKSRGRQSNEHDVWQSLLRQTERAVTSKMMRNWCDARDVDEAVGDAEEEVEEKDWEHDADNDGCVVRKIAHILLSAA